jgi:hypothetical protein
MEFFALASAAAIPLGLTRLGRNRILLLEFPETAAAFSLLSCDASAGWGFPVCLTRQDRQLKIAHYS